MNQKTFMVTGATSGIGREIVMRLVALGANVALCGRSEQKLKHLLEELPEHSGNVYYRAFDATDSEMTKDFIAGALLELGQVDVLVNCAGANTSRHKVEALPVDTLNELLALNTVSPFVFMQEIYNRSMKPRNEGMIINVLSTVCHFSNEGIGAYTASKASFDALTKVFRKEVREYGIKVCAIYPGGVDTPFREAERPLYLSAEQVADAVLYMASQPAQAVVDELTIRPLVEKNYP